ncbi:hypothetical protein THRCLA_22091 [Thraustotheca clavata]|uniref:Uncharacterized protein n=1 Tax=Thraustotheca clavata TaxID=74557 RepID=A0A1V9ZCD0_9STRA|nr:hypothetical protein THRCLA_22091 [Thraustotheca clavata]
MEDEEEIAILEAELAKIQRAKALAIQQIDTLKIEQRALQSRLDSERRTIQHRDEQAARQRLLALEQEAKRAKDAERAQRYNLCFSTPHQNASQHEELTEFDDLEAYLQKN